VHSCTGGPGWIPNIFLRLSSSIPEIDTKDRTRSSGITKRKTRGGLGHQCDRGLKSVQSAGEDLYS